MKLNTCKVNKETLEFLKRPDVQKAINKNDIETVFKLLSYTTINATWFAAFMMEYDIWDDVEVQNYSYGVSEKDFKTIAQYIEDACTGDSDVWFNSAHFKSGFIALDIHGLEEDDFNRLCDTIEDFNLDELIPRLAPFETEFPQYNYDICIVDTDDYNYDDDTTKYDINIDIHFYNPTYGTRDGLK